MIDSHAHLADPAFDTDREEVIARAREAGLDGIVCIGESLAAADRARLLASAQPGFLWFTAGIHPHDAAGFDEATAVPAIREMIDRGAVAVGECGLDYHYDHSPRERQRHAFAAQLDIAREAGRPVVAHTREAEADTAQLVADAGRKGVRGVLHCFTGSHALARTGLDAGWMISFSGIVTFRKWDDVELLRLVPGDRLLVESDAPYLAPVPHRGKRNEPGFVPRTVAHLAAVRGVNPGDLAAQTAENARRLFNLRAPR
ncbi:MAG TPA: TatD family hydrolase [Gemmatimonadaceae bacterium]|nr:TatD family hydrolase [Gemmatimonadaceae bacterium]